MKMIRVLIAMLLFSSVFPAGCAKTPEEKELKKSRDTIEIVMEGVVQPSREALIVAPVSEKITAVLVKNGERVKRGQTIARYDTYKLRIAYQEALTQYKKAKVATRFEKPAHYRNGALVANAQDRVLKTYELYKNGNASLAELKTAEDAYLNLHTAEETARNTARREAFQTAKQRSGALKDVERASLMVDKAQYEYRNARITALIDGYVTDLEMFPGQVASNGETLGKIINIDQVTLKGAFSPGVCRYLKRGMTVDIGFLTTPPLKMKGVIREISPVIDSESKRMSLYIPLKNRHYLLQPGDKALISMVLPRKDAEKAGIETEDDKAVIRSDIKPGGVFPKDMK